MTTRPQPVPAPTSSPRLGRRTGGGTKGIIEAAARRQFAEHGLGGVSVRSVAKAAAVDPGLIRHYFGSKEGLFETVVQLPVDPEAVIAYVTAEGSDHVGGRLAEVVAELVLDEERSVVMAALVRAATEPAGAHYIRDIVTRRIIEPLARSLSVDRPERRSALISSQVIGFVLAARIVGLQPLAEMTRTDIIGALAPAFQRYLTAPLELSQ